MGSAALEKICAHRTRWTHSYWCNSLLALKMPRGRRRMDAKCTMVTVLAVLLLGLPGVAAQCPNLCSGHGVCNNQGLCECWDGWAAAPDCSRSA